MGRIRVIALALLTATSACGPIVYVSEVTRSASTNVEAARAAQADKYAPYWWTRATQYIHQARVKAAYADFEGANRFGRLANEAAKQAITEAAIAEKDPSKRPLELDKQPAPAKGGDQGVVPANDGVAPAKDD